MTQKSKEIYLFTINSLSPPHYQKVYKKVGHQNVTDDKAGNVLPSEQNINFLYSVSEVNFYVILNLETHVYEKYFDLTLHILYGAFYIISHNSIAKQIKEGFRPEIFNYYIKIQHDIP